jgi:catechol 2,3-dioxygenase-like lactoylglutathione lyase family enzyme
MAFNYNALPLQNLNTMQQLITGIQQIGIGVSNADEAKYLYKHLFGMNVQVFDDTATAHLMTAYTGNTIHTRRALLTLNMQGGGGFEIWQFTSKQATSAANKIQLGDIGIYAAIIKCKEIQQAHTFFSSQNNIIISAIETAPNNQLFFWVVDAYGNHFKILEQQNFFKPTNQLTGGVCGAVIGVSNMNEAITFYTKLLGIETIEYDVEETISNSQQRVRKVLLSKPTATNGAFANLLGDVQIELVQAINYPVNKIFANRFWGDCGFIHLCFDVLDMDALKNHAAQLGYTFTVDSANSFAMEGSAGRFCYVETPDGTLIELVETHKVPIYKKWGIYLPLKKGTTQKPLPNWMINLLGISKVK